MAAGLGRSIITRSKARGSRIGWAKGVRKQHRTLGATLNTSIDAGFVIRRVEEWSPSPEQVADQPSLAEEMDRPMMALVAAQK